MARKKRRTHKKRIKTRKTARSGRLITPEDLLKLHFVSDPQISPDGSAIVFVKKHAGEKNEYVSNLWLVGTDGETEPRQFTSGGKDSHPRFSPDGSRLAFISKRSPRGSKPQIYVMNAPPGAGEATALTKFPEGTLSSFRWSPDGSCLAVMFREQDPQWAEKAKKDRETSGESTPPRVLDDWWYRLDGDGYFNAQRHQLYIVDAATGEHRVLYDKDTLGIFDFDFSPDSKQLVVATNRDRKAMIRQWKYELVKIDVKTGRQTKISDLPRGPKGSVRWSPDGKSIAYAGRIGDDSIYSSENLHLFVCDARSGKARNLTERTDYCLLAAMLTDSSDAAFAPHLIWGPDSKRIFFRLGWQGEVHVASVPAGGGKVSIHTRGALAHDFGNLSDDGSQLAMTIGGPTMMNEIHVGKVGPTIRTRQLTNFNGPLLSKLRLAEPEMTWVKAADGRKTQVWTLKPPDAGGRSGRAYPGVLEIHGGPHAMYGVGFFHEMQVLAAAGYVVVFSNPRGSKGYGQKHCAAIRGSWGNKDWEDIQAVIKFMRSRRFIDSRRMGVMGGSYGGYMTNWVIGHTKEFAGAITDRCVSNLVSMFGSSDFTDEPDRYWPGNSWDRTEQMWEMSPLKHLGNATTPTLIIHSEGDLRCNVEQAEQVFTALKLLDVPTRFVRYPSSTFHGLSRTGPPDLRLHRLQQILSWWKKYLRK